MSATPTERPRRIVGPLLVEVALFMALTVVYEWARALVRPDDSTAALANAATIVDMESAVGLYVEADVQRFFNGLPGGEASVAWLYTATHTPGFICFFAWLWWRHRDRFRFVWLWFWLGHAVAVMVFWLWPLAPPRLTAAGFEDVTKETLKLGGALDWFQSLRNEYAAMPSLHVGYTIFFATVITLIGVTRKRWLAWLWPGAMLVVVMATANHFWLDAVGGALVMATGYLLALAVRKAVRLRLRLPRQVPA